MTDAAVNMVDVRLAFSDKEILRGVSCRVEQGDYVSIIGPNGAGKTTLVKCLAGIYTHWRGGVEVHGKNIREVSQRQLAREMSYVPQAEGRGLPFSAFDFVLMGRYPHLSPFSSVGAEDRECAKLAMEQVDVWHLRDRHLDTLSGGERQMVFIAAALVQSSNILLLDEPASFLDYRHQVQVQQVLSRLNQQQGITVISISHDLNAALEVSNRILALKDGQVAFEGTPEKIADSAVLESIYQTPFVCTTCAHRTLPLVTPGGGL